MINRPIYVDKIMTYADTPFVKILTGIRRCGKSTILKMLMDKMKERGIHEEQILHYSFDSLEYEDIKTAKALFAHFKQHLFLKGKTYLFLDEIQEVKSWEKVVNSLMADYDVDIYVTGSNSRMMSSEISTYLTGRYIAFRIYPLSFSEYMTFRKKYTEILDSYTELANYLRLGGFPAVHLQKYTPDEVYTIVRDIYNSTIFTDIVRRNQIRKVDQLERIVKFAFDNVGRTFSAASVSKYLKSENRAIDNETVYNYLSKLESAYILHRCSRFDVQGKEILKTQEKFYLADPALRYSVLGYSANSAAAMLENIMYLELLRRGYDVYVGKLENAEIDFIAIKQENKLYIQVTQEIGSPETEKREYGRLLDIRDNYPKYVLRTDAFAGGNYEGIKTMHVADFLLSDEY
ncbi:ATP-binding protein [Lachnoclostridium pacaense]|uniref:ATP-binding protein n=1 Tax=Enterocloster hominis (ex Hitch et al. 2024) TaxID=1917870 RepID=UPI001D0F6FF2|nr:ATP-binding protein [Lachnoclostridium pacaense]MCC2820591.1 ATP-binding protein [Lachnoclostridium pacaense]